MHDDSRWHHGYIAPPFVMLSTRDRVEQLAISLKCRTVVVLLYGILILLPSAAHALLIIHSCMFLYIVALGIMGRLDSVEWASGMEWWNGILE